MSLSFSFSRCYACFSGNFKSYSSSFSHPSNSDVGDLISEPWFVSLLGSVVFVLVLLFAGIVFYRRQWARQAKSLGHLPVPPVGNR